MKVSVTGATGLVGAASVALLQSDGHDLIRLVRRAARAGEVTWDPRSDSFDASPLDGSDAVIHLAGENVAASRWTPEVKERIRSSRVEGTRILSEGLADLSSPPQVLVCASAIGYYGDRGDEILTEESGAGTGFLCDVAQQWEAATQAARDAGIRVLNLRIGVVLSPEGGALSRMVGPFKFGCGGRVGSGRQVWSWISLDDAAGAVYHAMKTDSLSGAVNLVAPNPVTNREFAKTLGRVLRRPAALPLPAFAARMALGEMADELLLASTRVDSGKLIQSGYEFRHPTLEPTLRYLLGRSGK